ncbi:MAG: hypothetical protein AAFP84_20490 [Actinomycetota bacterium]
MSLTDHARPADAPTRGAATKPRAPRPRVRLPWLLVTAGLFVFIVMLVLWALSSASERTQVLVVVEPVAAGEPIPDSAIGTTGLSNDDGFGRIYVESQRSEIVGAVAVTDLEPGDLLGPALVTNAPDTFTGERLVGAVLRAGRYPEQIQRGDEALAVSIVDRAAVDPATVPVRVVAVSFSETAEASVTLAVADEDAALVGTWAGTDELVVVVRPIGVDE